MSYDVEGLSVVYSLMYSLEYLERGLISGDVTLEDYTNECNSLLNSSKLLNKSIDYFNQFNQNFGLDFQLAIKRINIGTPDNYNNTQDVGIFDLSGNFITLIDALKLGINNSNDLYVLVCEIMRSIEMNDKCFTGDDFWSKFNLEKLTFWAQKLSTNELTELNNVNKVNKELLGEQLRREEILEELTNEELSQFLSDMESTYHTYRQHLKQHK